MRRIYITRKELYDQVWAKPMIKLAKQYYMSDVALRKICKKNDISLPPTGHWARKQHGYNSPKIKLSGDPQRKIDILIRDTAVEIQAKVKKDTKVQEFTDIVVPEEVGTFHPLTRQIKQKMKEKFAYHDGAYHFRRMRISKENWERGVRIYDTALRAIEKNFGKLESDDQGVFINLKNEKMHIYLHEKIDAKNVTPPLTEKQKEEIKKNPWRESYINPVQWEYIPTNKMTLSIEGGGTWGILSRRNFKDGTSNRLEDQISDFLSAIKNLADIGEQAQIKRKHEGARRESARKEWQQKELEAQLAKEKLSKLEAQLKDWKHAEDIRTFVNACIKRAKANPESISSFKEFNEWVKMAREYADTFDPLCGISGISPSHRC